MAGDRGLVRQWLLVTTLAARRLGVTVAELAGEFAVNEKTIRRDLERLRTAGFPIDESTEGHGRKRWRISAQWPGELRFTFDEALALYLGRRLLDPLAGTLLFEAAQRGLRKIRATLDQRALHYLDRMATCFYQTTLGAGDYAAQGDVINQLCIGIEDRRATFITYRSQQATEPVTYDVYPYGFAQHRGSLYLVGYAPRHEQMRRWKVNRIERAETTEVRFQVPAGFNLAAHFADDFAVFHGSQIQRIRVRFSRDVARYVSESQWHSSQKLSPQSDGSLLAEFMLSSTVELKSWLLSFGAHVEVVSPDDFRQEMREEIGRMGKRYDASRAKSKPLKHGK